MKNKLVLTFSLCIGFFCGVAINAQGPIVSIDPHRHKNLAVAQNYIALAYQEIANAESSHNEGSHGHAAQAKALLIEAAAELKMAAEAPGVPQK